MSFLEKNYSNKNTESGLCINDLVARCLSGARGEELYLKPLIDPQTGAALSYYGKPISLTTKETKGLRKLSRLFNSLAQQGIISDTPVPNLAIEWGKSDEMRLAFFPLSNAFVHAKEFSLAKRERAEEKIEPEKVFVTGTCMYGKDGVTGKTDKGKSLALVDPLQMKEATYEEYGCITDLEYDDEFHPYEVLGALSRGNILNSANANTVYFNVPVSSYVLYAKDAIAKGLMSAPLMKEWVEKLKARASDLIFYEQAVCEGTVIPVDPLYPYLDYISQPETTLDDLSKFLARKESWWAAYLQAEPPESYADIGYGGYVQVYYDLLGKEDIERTVLAVEDQTEMRLFLELKRLIEKGVLQIPNNRASIVGLYPFAPIIFPDGNGVADATFLTSSLQKNDSNALRLLDISSSFIKTTLAEKAKTAYASICGGTAKQCFEPQPFFG